jgi:hypothetical protein
VKDTVPARSAAALARIGAVVVLAAAVAVVVWLVLKDDDHSSVPVPARATPVAATPAVLERLSRELGQPIYWAGERPGYTYEVTRTSQGDTYVRYLPPGVSLGDQKPDYVTVGTYPFTNAYRALKRRAGRRGSIVHRLSGGGIAVIGRDHPNSVYVAYRGRPFQVEVYARSITRASRLVTSGRLQPVG